MESAMIKSSLFHTIALIAFFLSELTAGAAAQSTSDTGQAALTVVQASSQEQSGGMSMMGQGMAGGMMQPGMMQPGMMPYPITLARPRTAVTRVSDEFAHAKRELWEAMQDARSASGSPGRAARAEAHSH